MSQTDPMDPQNENNEESNKPVETNLEGNKNNKTSTGLEENVASLIAYLAGFVSGIIFLILEKENKVVRFHALQSIALTVSYLILDFVFNYVPLIGWLFNLLLYPAGLVLWILCMVKAYQGQKFKIPVLGDLADQYK
ncbi:DUF4870 domain-containing protein [Bacillus niameyensis]|uniref:DUF4870 domain-containing protein n=1 Tax=Bacillus niameyensis TaxID=1522308 RepID=UPI000AC29FAB|nr:DUF4870 domain-containing protein [Bacillus niameyensis]